MSKNELIKQEPDEDIKKKDIRDKIIEDNRLLAIAIIVFVVYMTVAIIYR